VALTAEVFKQALAGIEGRGLTHLEEFYRSSMENLARTEPPPLPPRVRPLVYTLVDHKGWCGERLSADMARACPRIDCRTVRLGDHEHMRLDADMYLYRNITWVHGQQLPPWVLKRTICLLESERCLAEGLGEDYRLVRAVVPLNLALSAMLYEKTGIVSEAPLPNGVNASEFRPAPGGLPEEFTVGAAGNFSLDWYDEWKGFSRYIVPACERAGVRLKWCGWMGKAHGAALKGEQIPLAKMGDWYRSLSVLVSASKSEACSSVMAEALACGVPVLSTPTGWHWEEGQKKSGIAWFDRPTVQTPESDELCISQLTAQIKELRSHRSRLEAMGADARAFSERWSWDSIGPQWETLLFRMLDRVGWRAPAGAA